ncbi:MULTISPECIES: glycoside hydrolase family 3 C-terminal domain-containing protein [Natrialbaceae]|uniref:glycoside hydrolase family 3 C-terminal domain-containing protein n=1 Tax=Natrialbaceae TaxID=1644061 RepID=UPI00207CFA56|nr:glycoside hydrolase family 3 C-terminal domain-containing protein [Natronococcus sp. CG52]
MRRSLEIVLGGAVGEDISNFSTVDTLETWYPGQTDGEALADVLFGDADPGGRLLVTFGRSPADYPTADEAAFPATDDVARYDEGVFVGYRYFDEHDLEPLFPFGHGLSYATSEYDDGTVPRPTTAPT